MSSPEESRWVARLLVVFAAILIALLTRATLASSFGHDEIEHAHVTWQLTQGLDPYVAFHQNHTPTIWLMAAPILELMPADARALIALRGLALASIVVIAIMAVKVTRRLHAGHPRLVELELWVVIATLLVAYAIGAFRFRPDPPMAALVAVAGGLLVLQERPRWPVAVGIGLALGLAATLSLKVWPIGIVVAVVAWRTLRRQGWKGALRLVVGIGVGFVIPVLALVAWLASRDLLGPFVTDVLAFNAGYRTSPGVLVSVLDLPLLYLAFAGWVASLVRSDHEMSVARLLFVGGLGATLLAAHGTRYMLLAAMFGFVLMVVEIVRWTLDQPTWTWRRWSVDATLARWGLLFVVSGLVVRPLVMELESRGTATGGASPAAIDAMLALVHEHERPRCFALAPVHPVFCHDAVPLAIEWDLHFLWHPTPRFRQRQHQLWDAGLRSLREAPAELVFMHRDTRLLDDERLDAQARARLAEVWRTRYNRVAVSADVGALVLKR